MAMDQYTRRITGFGVHAGDVDGIALCRMFNAAIYSKGVPEYISSDNDPLFLFHQWQADLRILDTDEIKTVPYTPLSHRFIERLIGTIWREFLDQTLFWNASHLVGKLVDFRQYYNSHHVHTAPDGVTPAEFSGKCTGTNTSIVACTRGKRQTIGRASVMAADLARAMTRKISAEYRLNGSVIPKQQPMREVW